jgi:hypothetical protein
LPEIDRSGFVSGAAKKTQAAFPTAPESHAEKLRVGSVDRANARAGAAFDAQFGIDAVLAVFIDGYCADRAFRFAGAAAEAFIFVDTVCHK